MGFFGFCLLFFYLLTSINIPGSFSSWCKFIETYFGLFISTRFFFLPLHYCILLVNLRNDSAQFLKYFNHLNDSFVTFTQLIARIYQRKQRCIKIPSVTQITPYIKWFNIDILHISNDYKFCFEGKYSYSISYIEFCMMSGNFFEWLCSIFNLGLFDPYIAVLFYLLLLIYA